MKYLIIALVALSNSACMILAPIYDNADKCQKTDLIKTGQYPSYCGSGGSQYTTRDWRTGNYVYSTTKTR